MDRSGAEVWDAVEAAGMVGFGRRVCDWVAEKEGSWAELVGDSERCDSAGPTDPNSQSEILGSLSVNLLGVHLTSVL